MNVRLELSILFSWQKNFLEILQKGTAITRVSFKSNLIKYVKGYGQEKYHSERDRFVVNQVRKLTASTLLNKLMIFGNNAFSSTPIY